MGVIDAQRLDPGASGGIPHHVDRQQRAGLEHGRRPASDPDDEGRSDQVPDQLVEERRVVQRIGSVDLEPPRQRGLAAVELLVEPVAQTPDGLGHQQRRGHGIGQQRHRVVLVPAPAPGGQRAEQDAAPDAQAAVPDAYHLHRIAVGAEEPFGRGDDVVDARADDARQHRDDGDVEDLVEVAADLFPPRRGDGHGGDDARQDAQRVEVYGQRADLEGGDRRRRYRC